MKPIIIFNTPLDDEKEYEKIRQGFDDAFKNKQDECTFILVCSTKIKESSVLVISDEKMTITKL